MRNFLMGVFCGLAMGATVVSLSAANHVLPQYLMYGRTSGGMNVPVLVDASGIVQVKTN
jgi:hypothetical protein